MVNNVFKCIGLSIAMCSAIFISHIGYTDTQNAELNNIGATCYMNATVQSMANLPGFNNCFLNVLWDNNMGKGFEPFVC